jgi:predicted acylesterase/phospholipase RssA
VSQKGILDRAARLSPRSADPSARDQPVRVKSHGAETAEATDHDLMPTAQARSAPTWLICARTAGSTKADRQVGAGRAAMPEAGRRKVFEARLPASAWPSRALKVTAVDARTGEFVVFDSAGAAGLVDAVGAGCAVPWLWPPVTIGERRFMDGGMRTAANADLAHAIESIRLVAKSEGMRAGGSMRRWVSA